MYFILRFNRTLVFVFCLLIIAVILPFHSFAESTTVEVPGKRYEFDEDSHYDYLNEQCQTYDSDSRSYGTFLLEGDLTFDGLKDGMAAYVVNTDTVSLKYIYDDSWLIANEREWHFISDKTKQVANLDVDKKIGKGVLILQSSKDGKEWSPTVDISILNLFETEPNKSDSFYAPNSIQLANGCYYRLIVAYETARKVGESKVLFVTKDVIDYKKTAEVYEFYLHDSNQSVDANSLKRTLGDTVNTGKDNGYSEANSLDIKDPHYGWTIGDFFVSGYTRETKDDDGTPVFLKTLGDKVTLWFNLKQDINALNGDDILSISEDVNGYDKYFQTDKMNMGRGTLIVRYTDEKGVKHDPEIYTNYLSANATTSADTVVKIFEEGDYEVALDYEIKKTPRKVGSIEVVPEYTNYRIFFSFKIRNGNCMVYPFDVVTRSELTDETITANGFFLDMAKSRYLNIDVTRAVVTMGANGYVEDIRFDRPAKDGDQYTDEGIYTFRVKNLYTGESIQKKIYVGDTDYMRALSRNNITVSDLNYQLAQGGVIESDGSIISPSSIEETVDSEPLESSSNEAIPDESAVDTGEESDTDITNTSKDASSLLPIVLIVLLAIGGVGIFCIMKKGTH